MEFGDLLIPLLFAVWIYGIFDVIRTPDGNTENLPKMIWLLIVVFFNFIGAIAWFLLGRPRHGEQPARFDLRSAIRRDTPPPVAPAAPPVPPVDNDEYQRKRDEAIRRYNARREEELRRHEEEMERRARELRQREQGTSESS
jgi:hypothetical protein